MSPAASNQKWALCSKTFRSLPPKDLLETVALWIDSTEIIHLLPYCNCESVKNSEIGNTANYNVVGKMMV